MFKVKNKKTITFYAHTNGLSVVRNNYMMDCISNMGGSRGGGGGQGVGTPLEKSQKYRVS